MTALCSIFGNCTNPQTLKLKTFIIIFLIFSGKILFSQNDNEVNLVNYSKLMGTAYDNKDTAAYRIIIDNFLTDVNKLDTNLRKNYNTILLNAYYNYSCIYSLTGNKDKAIDYLQKSKFNDYNHLLIDTDLDNIRNEKRFKTYLKNVKKNALESHLETLKNAAQYNFNDKRKITKFTYKSINDSDLVLLRKTFNLDSIAGTGNEVLQILNILHWVHNTFIHDGLKDSPNCNGIVNLMNICIKEHKTLDCETLAGVANNCFLAMGFKSRQVVCLPKDSTDMDCHSINTVYSNTLNKWLWIDPTNYAYLMNEKGELLSIAEVRERLINDKPLILNPDANWNNKFSTVKEFYINEYMAKNLYAFQCYVSGGGESKSNLLVPLEYKGIIPRTAINKPKVTNNPDLFWAKPE